MQPETPIEYVKGVGPDRARLFREELGIYTAADLLEYYPFRYIDRTRFYKVREISDAQAFVQVKGMLKDIQETGEARKKRLTAKFYDETGEIELIWFQGIRWVKGMMRPGVPYVLFGKPNVFGTRVNIAHPELEEFKEGGPLLTGLQPMYHSSEKLGAKGLNSRGIEKIIKGLVGSLNGHVAETLPDYVKEEGKLLSLEGAFRKIHQPADQRDIFHAQRRLKFEELFFLQLSFAMQKLITKNKIRGYVFGEVGKYFNDFYTNHLSFPLTEAQKRVVREIRQDCGTGKQMNRLLQGDVGSGKTIVAVLCALIAADNGFQSCLMAPTEILASQHYQSITPYFEKLGLGIALLTGSTKRAERNRIHEGLMSGEIQLLVGTHALLEDAVKYKNLGLAIIDEQHRFGVQQRARLWEKNTLHPHVLVMTATPIPRTLAMTLYGDLDVSVIDELPLGRKPIVTLAKNDSRRLEVFGFMEKEISLGRQVYVVYPLIEESEAMDYKDLMDGFESITRSFPLPQYKVSIVHGKMKPADKDFEMQRFLKGETQIMVATTVIEVGVNVPNASIMVIESAERFGLSQLHQLRGRVGRGAEQSYCVLMTGNKLSNEARERVATMCETNDGFKIAEVDLKLRGPGDILGTKQSGLLNLKIADLTTDGAALEFARNLALRIIEEDQGLGLPKNEALKRKMLELQRTKTQWSKIL
ncbi:MAG: ATP-dependent DNA helicase RecG [Bacteroidota bacterium]